MNSTEYIIAEYVEDLITFRLKNDSIFDIVITKMEWFKRNIDIRNVYNMRLIEWNGGNILNRLIYEIFFYSHSTSELANIYKTCFVLIHDYEVKIDELDNDMRTALDFIKLVRWGNLIQEQRSYIPAFKFLFIHGKNVKKIQEDLCLIWFLKRRKRRRDAVLKISENWLETLYNPNTIIGSKNLCRLSQKWHSDCRGSI